MHTYLVSEVGVRSNKGQPRIWLENQRMVKAGFKPGVRYALETGEQRVVLTICADGTRKVAAHKKGDREIPVIDLNSAVAIGCFAGLDKVRVIFRENEIHLLPLASQKKAKERLDRLRNKLETNQPLKVASFCHGGGVLNLALSQGLHSAGVPTELVIANDIEPGVLFHASEVNPSWNKNTIAVAAPIEEVVTDDYLMGRVGKVDVLEAGLPCVGASLSGRAKKGLDMAEADKKAGHLVVPFLAIIEKMQPVVCLLENVPPYANTASAHMIRNVLADWGYTVHETILSATEFGCLEDRKRLCLVAVTAGVEFDFSQIEKPAFIPQTLGDVLEDIPPDAECWKEYTYLREKEIRDKDAGKGFRMQILGPEATSVGTIGAAYAKVRSTEVKVQHPSNDKLMRQLTPLEHARCKRVEPALIEGLPDTRAHHLLGNAIAFPPFFQAGRLLAKCLQRTAETSDEDSGLYPTQEVFVLTSEPAGSLLEAA